MVDWAEKAELSERERDVFAYHEQMKHRIIMTRMLRLIREFMYDKERGTIKLHDRDTIDSLEKISPGFKILYQHFAHALSEDKLSIDSILAIDPDSCITEFDPTLQEILLVQESASRLGPEVMENLDQMLVRRVFGPSNAERIMGPDEGPKENSQEQKAHTEHGAFRPGYFVPTGTDDNHMVHAVIHEAHATRLMARYEDRLDEFAEEAPLQPKVEAFREFLVLWNHNMGTDPNSLGHVKIVEQANIYHEEAKVLLQKWGKFFGLLQKLQAEIKEQSEAEANRAVQDAQAPDPVQSEKVLTEQLKRELMVADHKVKTGIKIDEHQLEQRIKSIEAQTSNLQPA